MNKSRYIQAQWAIKKGRWDDKARTYVDCTEEPSVHTLAMVLQVINDGSTLVHFEGGPTGFETYRVQHLLDNPEFGRKDTDELCICLGTINRWPTVTVNAKEVRQFIEEAT